MTATVDRAELNPYSEFQVCIELPSGRMLMSDQLPITRAVKLDCGCLEMTAERPQGGWVHFIKTAAGHPRCPHTAASLS